VTAYSTSWTSWPHYRWVTTCRDRMRHMLTTFVLLVSPAQAELFPNCDLHDEQTSMAYYRPFDGDLNEA